jgi:biopolymer transport protein ExbD
MRFKKRVTREAGLRQFDIASLIDCVFLLLIFFMLTSNFMVMPGITIKLPKAFTSEQMNTQTLTIVISSEDIIYFEGKPFTIKELDNIIEKNKYKAIFIKADRDASLGAVVEVWDLCKRKKIERVGIATTHQE